MSLHPVAEGSGVSSRRATMTHSAHHVSRGRYRADVDGLRAIAVLPVVLYHAGLPYFGGGFVGVDVFFVISGYLITGIILDDLRAGTFSILRFYERRIRRIFPALFVVMGFSTLAAAALLVPSDLVAYADSVVAATLSASNFLFWSESGYFAIDAERQPLLHTWSLAVEEQFYVLFPPLLVLLFRFRAGLHQYRWLAALGVVSFVASVFMVRTDTNSAFYLLPTRAWELMIGALLAGGAVQAPAGERWRTVLGAGGLLLIAASVFGYSSDTPFPGAAALPPTIGTALVILSGSGGSSVVSRVLSLQPLVFIGLISYSLYLWHWPLLVFTRYWSVVEPGTLTMIGVVAASIVLATLSWRYVETPFRTKSLLPERRRVFQVAAVTMMLFGVVGASLHLERGVVPGLNHPADAMDVLEAEWKRWGDCEQRVESPSNFEPCAIGSASAPPTFLLWGDSHARSLASGVDISASESGRGGRVATKSGCPPLLGIERRNRVVCAEFNQRVIQYLRDHPELQTVVLSGRWALSAEGTPYGNEVRLRDRRVVELVDLESKQTGTAREMFRRGLQRTVDALERLNRRVVLVAQVPEIGYDVPSAAVVARRTGRDVNRLIAPLRAEYEERNRFVFNVFTSLSEAPGIAVIDPARRLCYDVRCTVIAQDAPLYRDDHHLSTHGAHFVAPLFDPLFQGRTAASVLRTSGLD